MTPSNEHDRDAMITGLTPHDVERLIEAGEALADRVREQTLHSPRPVFLYYIGRTLDALTTELNRGKGPRPTTPAGLLCLHLMIADLEEQDGATQDSANDPSEDGPGRVRAALMPADTQDPLAALGLRARPNRQFDFIALGDALNGQGMDVFFAPFETDGLVA